MIFGHFRSEVFLVLLDLDFQDVLQLSHVLTALHVVDDFEEHSLVHAVTEWRGLESIALTLGFPLVEV